MTVTSTPFSLASPVVPVMSLRPNSLGFVGLLTSYNTTVVPGVTPFTVTLVAPTFPILV